MVKVKYMDNKRPGRVDIGGLEAENPTEKTRPQYPRHPSQPNSFQERSLSKIKFNVHNYIIILLIKNKNNNSIQR